MANNKDFIVKNAVEVGGATKVTLGDAAAAGSYTQGYDLANAAYDSVSFSVTSQETEPYSISFKPDGTKMYVSGYTGDAVYQYSLSTAWDISTASYDSKSLSVSSQTTVPTGIFFKSDGTSIYVCDFNVTSDVFQYDLNTAWDISTASYASKSFDASSQCTQLTGITFNQSGSKMYLLDNQGATYDIYQYSLSTAWDVSTASYDSVFLYVGGEDLTPNNIKFNSDGSELFLVGQNTDTVYKYTFVTPYDLSTATYSGESFSVVTQATSPTDLFFSVDGTKMFVLNRTTDTIYQYSTGSTVTTGSFDLSTGNYFTDTPSADVEYTFSNAGDVQTVQLEVTGASIGYDISGASYDSVSFSISAQDTNPHGIFFKPDGTKMYILGFDGDDINEYTLSTAWDITTASFVQSFSVATQEATPQSFFFKPDGTKMYVTGYTGDDVNEYNLSTAWDVSTASFVQNFSVATQETVPEGLSFKPDGTKMYVIGSTSDSIHEYNLSTAWDVSTASYVQGFSVATQDTNPTDLFFKSDGLKFYIIGFSGDDINEYSLSTAWDVSTASYTQNFSFASEDTTPRDVFFKSDGTKMYMVGATGDAVYQYTTSSTATLTWPSSIEWAGGTAPDSPAAGEKDLYTITTDDGGTTYFGVQSGDAFS